jgi:hypothetical protein
VVRQQLATAQEWIQRHVPCYRIRTLALPMGAYPQDIRWAIEGAEGQVTYRHDAVLMVAGGAAPSPYARAFDPYRLRVFEIQLQVAGRSALLGHRALRAVAGDRRRAVQAPVLDHPHEPPSRKPVKKTRGRASGLKSSAGRSEVRSWPSACRSNCGSPA